MPGFTELLLLLIILFIVFGAKTLPQLGEALGKAVRKFRGSAASQDQIQVAPRSDDTTDDDPPSR